MQCLGWNTFIKTNTIPQYDVYDILYSYRLKFPFFLSRMHLLIRLCIISSMTVICNNIPLAISFSVSYPFWSIVFGIEMFFLYVWNCISYISCKVLGENLIWSRNKEKRIIFILNKYERQYWKDEMPFQPISSLKRIVFWLSCLLEFV